MIVLLEISFNFNLKSNENVKKKNQSIIRLSQFSCAPILVSYIETNLKTDFRQGWIRDGCYLREPFDVDKVRSSRIIALAALRWHGGWSAGILKNISIIIFKRKKSQLKKKNQTWNNMEINRIHKITSLHAINEAFF